MLKRNAVLKTRFHKVCLPKKALYRLKLDLLAQPITDGSLQPHRGKKASARLDFEQEIKCLPILLDFEQRLNRVGGFRPV